MGAEVDNQVAAPAEMSTPNLHRAKIAQKECGWKDGDRGGPARRQSNPQERRRKQKEKNLLTGEKKKNILDTHWPSHGRTYEMYRKFDPHRPYQPSHLLRMI
jgi:hypothetical protein